MSNEITIIIPLVFFFILDLIIVCKSINNKVTSNSQKIFINFAFAVLIQQGLPIINFSCDYGLLSLNLGLQYFCNIVSLIMMVGASYFWFGYLVLTIPNKKKYTLITSIGLALPYIGFVIATIASPLTHWVFYLDDNQIYQRGTMYFLQLVCPYIYVLFMIIIALKEIIKGNVKKISLTLRNFTVFIVPSIIGALIQIFVFRGGYTQIGASFGLILMYLDQYLNEINEIKRLKSIETYSEKLRLMNEYQEKQLDMIKSMNKIYFASYYIDLSNNSFVEIVAKDSIRKFVSDNDFAQDSLFMACDQLIAPEHAEKMRRFVDLSTINERLKHKQFVSCEYIGLSTGWSRSYLIAGDRDENGNLKHIFYASQTIHDEKERESEQTKRLEDYNNIIANAGIGIWHITIKNNEKPRMEANEKMRELLGIIGKDFNDEEIYEWWYSHIIPDALESVQNSVNEMLSGNYSENTYLWNHPANGNIYVRCGGTAVKDTDGTCILSGYHYDVTKIVLNEEKQKRELALAREAAEAANEAKTSFLFNMSHDIRTPMNAIMGFRDLLEKHQDEPDKRRDYLKKIEESSAILLSIINNVLEMARIEKGTIELEEKALSAEQFFDSIYLVFQEMMRQKNIEFTRRISVNNHFVYCDSTKLREVFINILSNAYKYTNPGGKVDMYLEEIACDRPGYVIYQTTISDTGIGMSETFKHHIFEEFSRENNTTENKIEGTGLGMPIVKRLVELMGGTIEVDSIKGVGSTFVVKLPHKLADESEMSTPHKVDSSYNSFEGKRILLAEDNDLNAEITCEILNEEGFNVERAEDGEICVAMINAMEPHYYDAILMDVQMPNMNGYQATICIRELPDVAKATIPIIAMTANAFEEDKRNAYEAGMNGHIAKPIDINLMRSELTKFLI